MAYSIRTQGLPHLLRAARREETVVDIFTAKDMKRVGRTCPPPTHVGVRVIRVNGSVELQSADETIVEVPIKEIGGIRTKTVAAMLA